MATKPAEEAPQILKYQTWVFKVFIHCEGCKKKVRKILKDIEGVYATDVDSQQHKVTVTGNVDAQTLIKKLAKSGKYAEPWPEKPAQKEKKPAKSKNNNNNDKQKEPKDNNAGEVSAEAPKKGQSQKADYAAEGDGGSSPEEGGESEKAIPASAGGGKKKKKKKGQNGNPGGSAENVIDGGVTGSRVASVVEAVPPPIGSMNLGPQSLAHHHDYYPYPPPPPPAAAMNYHYAPPMYGMSYNTAYSSPATASSYYAPPHMHAFSSYSNPPGSYYLPPPSDPIYTFHDNDHHHGQAGCYIM